MGIADRLFGSARDRFGKEVAARVRAVDAVARADYDPVEFQVVVQGARGGEPSIINLETVFRETQGAPAGVRRAAIGRLVDIAALPPTPDHWDDVRATLRPVLRPIPADPKFDLVSRPAGPYLSEMLVLDTPSAMRYAARTDLKRWEVSAEEAFATAHRNMARTVTTSLDEARRREGSAEPIRLTDNGDAYLTSLPLVQGWLATMHRLAGARPLAFPISNNTLLLAYETDDAAALAKAFEVAEREWRESARPISPAPLTVDDEGAVVLYQPAHDHPAHAAVKHAQILLAMDAYGPQTEYLRAIAGPGDPFPAALKGFRSPEGAEVTAASWADDETSLLPAADVVAFPKHNEKMLLIPWTVVAEEARLTPAEGYHPARYRVGEWPDADVMERMRKLAAEAAEAARGQG
ncbi:conserved hypothetical protein [Catenulispora acidiphila DSM 44928]|uniref:DUF1444 domain-containing protein n=1 Tax=Catenulispora acidiphila (strain DSM 44928 / JCM 14897 / NBRC 102108 / NRRL B-24433 / ID139908) TaxID=479433 RepID=C7Q9F5_CATAD|nr:hypothetical protein [Catenulispora acidiphila]ACU74301.1 conserved hypothetical protein [Catenulispora acidiphila DSM 44928]